MNGTRERITAVTGISMIIVAGVFDALQFGTGILPLMGSVGSAIVGWVPLLGTLLGGALLTASIVLQSALSWLIGGIAYLVMSLWFLMHGVPLIGGDRASAKIITFFSALLVDFLPLLNVLPGLTLWVIFMVYLTRRHDKEERARYTEENARHEGRQKRTYVQ